MLKRSVIISITSCGINGLGAGRLTVLLGAILAKADDFLEATVFFEAEGFFFVVGFLEASAFFEAVGFFAFPLFVVFCFDMIVSPFAAFGN
jgi:hypothetical protein